MEYTKRYCKNKQEANKQQVLAKTKGGRGIGEQGKAKGEVWKIYTDNYKGPNTDEAGRYLSL